MIDDDEDDFFLVNTYLDDVAGQNFEVEWVPNATKGKESIQKKMHDLYLVDYRLGAFTGLDILNFFKELDYKAPVIMLTGKGDYNIDKAAMAAGAADFLVKGEFSAPMLERAIRYALDEFNHLQVIEENRRKYFGIFEKSHDIIILADCDKNIIDVNPSACKKLKATKEQLLNKSLKALFYNPREGQEFIDSICNDTNISQSPYSFVTIEQQKIEVLLNANMLDESKQIFLCVAEDITDKIKKEQVQRQLEKFAISGRIARLVAHEVRNPLTNILLAVSQFRQDPLPEQEEAVEYLDIMERNCSRINELISELLNTTRLQELEMQKHDINKLVEQSIAFVEDRLRLNQVNLRLQLVPEPIYIEADEEKVLVAFTNLLVNAIEAMQPEQGELFVWVNPGQEKVQVIFTDNGQGIEPDVLARLFEPFYTSKANGTGLGLASTQNIILSHKGTISVESEPGNGSTFKISFNRL